MSEEIEVPTGVALLGMVGAWAEDTEKHLTERLASARGKVTLSREEAGNIVDALKQVQESLVVVLNGDAALQLDQETGEAYIDPSEFMQAKVGTDHMYWRLHEHLNKHLVEGKSKRLSLSLADVKGYLNILYAAKSVFDALDGDDSGNNPGGGPRGGQRINDDVGTVESNVIYPDCWHNRQAA